MQSKHEVSRRIVTADGRRAQMYECKHTPGGGVHLREVATIENAHEGEHEHSRPSALGRGPSSNASQHFAGLGHEPEEERRAFAREVMGWVHRQGTAEAPIVVFAPAKFLGMLRDESKRAHGPTLVLEEGEFTHLRANELATQAKVAAVIGRVR